MGPSSIDLELRGLAPSEGGSNQVLLQFVKMISHMLDKKRDFQLTQAYLGLFLQVRKKNLGDMVGPRAPYFLQNIFFCYFKCLNGINK